MLQNEALLLKYLDKFYKRADLPWVHLVWVKHYRNGRLPNHIKKVHSGGGISSSFWININECQQYLSWGKEKHAIFGLIFGIAMYPVNHIQSSSLSPIS